MFTEDAEFFFVANHEVAPLQAEIGSDPITQRTGKMSNYDFKTENQLLDFDVWVKLEPGITRCAAKYSEKEVEQ
jgi:hypothetical protein